MERRRFSEVMFILALPAILVSWGAGMPTPLFGILLVLWCITGIVSKVSV